MSEGRRFLIISAHDHQTSEAYILDAHVPEGEPRLVESRQRGTEYHLSDRENEFLIRTNA